MQILRVQATYNNICGLSGLNMLLPGQTHNKCMLTSLYTAICNLVTLLSLNMTVAVADLALHAHPRACTMHLNGAYSTSS